jgi:hypothetical protein
MATGQANGGGGGLWISAAELAVERGVSRSAITQNLRRWAQRGAPVATRRRGRELLVNVAAYDAKHGNVATQAGRKIADSGPSRTVIPTHCGQRSGDCGQLLMSV